MVVSSTLDLRGSSGLAGDFGMQLQVGGERDRQREQRVGRWPLKQFQLDFAERFAARRKIGRRRADRPAVERQFDERASMTERPRPAREIGGEYGLQPGLTQPDCNANVINFSPLSAWPRLRRALLFAGGSHCSTLLQLLECTALQSCTCSYRNPLHQKSIFTARGALSGDA